MTDERLTPERGLARCPNCGSSEFSIVKPVQGTVLTADRECTACGTLYLTIKAPISGAVQAAMYSGGVVLGLGGVLAAMQQLAATTEPTVPRPTFHLYGIIFSFLAALFMFRMPQKIQQQREKRLKDYKDSAPLDAPPPIELPGQPDAVFISVLFGVLSLTAPLTSALLTVALFGPAALVSGAFAMMQGHAKGLIGFLLGVAGLIVWGLVFVFILQHGI
jgi:hypothetical protein